MTPSKAHEAKSKPLLFSGPMVRALLEGRKTQTRRIVKPQPPPEAVSVHLVDGVAYPTSGPREWRDEIGILSCNNGVLVDHAVKCPHPVGSLMWVRETWAPTLRGVEPDGWQDLIEFPADGTKIEVPKEHTAWFDRVEEIGYHNRPSIHMPRWASRITLKVTDVRVQRLQDISEEDAKAEGAERRVYEEDREGPWIGTVDDEEDENRATYRAGYQEIWWAINGAESWEANPFVWAYTFEVKAHEARNA